MNQKISVLLFVAFISALLFLQTKNYPKVKASIEGLPDYVYRVDPTGFVCGDTGPSPNIVEVRGEPEDNQHELEIQVQKCDGSTFVQDGTYEIWIDMDADMDFDNGDLVIDDGSYSAGDDMFTDDIDPVELGHYGPRYLMVKVYSQEQPTIPKHTGIIRIWEEYSAPDLPPHDNFYAVDPLGYVCGDYIRAQFIPNNTTHDIEVYIQKCDGGAFLQNGEAYVYLDGVPKWGPFDYQAGNTTNFLGYIDPLDIGFSGTHSYQVFAYAEEQPTNPNKYSGLINAWNFPPDTTPPGGNITSPTDGSNIGPGVITFTADASDNAGGSGINRVEFFVLYNGLWHLVCTDLSASYSCEWTTPSDLISQNLLLAIDVIDNADNRTQIAGGYRTISFASEPTGNERTIPIGYRFYLNQLSLSNPGNHKCGVSSIAMILAMNGSISGDYTSMSAEAEEMWNSEGVQYPSTSMVRDALIRRNYTASIPGGSLENKWDALVNEINAGRPVIVNSPPGNMTPGGHYIVAVGYKEHTDTTQRMIYAYDPFGRHSNCYPAGQCPEPEDRWDAINGVSETSALGRWVAYPWDKLNPNIVIASRNTNDPLEILLPAGSLFEPELISDEPSAPISEDPLTTILKFVFLPLITK